MPILPETFDAWTAGAQRVWLAACERAVLESAAELGVDHLLWGLLTVESRAAEQLQRAGVSTDAFLAVWQPPAAVTEPSAVELSRQAVVDAVIIEARNAAFQESAELGTEHLLSGLGGVPSPVADWLAQFQLSSVSDASQQRRSTPHATSEPIITAPELQVPWRDSRASEIVETYRILDAASNRAREGLRVVEDFVRWAWNDGWLSRELKECRHELTALLRQLPQSALMSARDTEQDVGTEIRTASEYRRESPAAVATASLKRIEEALRSLEEFSKIVDAELSPRFEQLRYRIYTLDKAIHTTQAARVRFADHRLCLLATSSLCHHGIGPAILSALQSGVRVIQLREKSLPDRELLALAQHVRLWTRDFEAIFIMNDRPDLAALAQADGVHLGQDDVPVAMARRILGPDKLVGVSTHSIEQARQAVREGADYLGVGPVFPSPTKAFEEFPGLDFVRQVADEIALPWFAIGGITQDNIPELLAAGATRIALSSAICSAAEPGWATEELLTRLAQSS